MLQREFHERGHIFERWYGRLEALVEVGEFAVKSIAPGPDGRNEGELRYAGGHVVVYDQGVAELRAALADVASANVASVRIEVADDADDPQTALALRATEATGVALEVRSPNEAMASGLLTDSMKQLEAAHQAGWRPAWGGREKLRAAAAVLVVLATVAASVLLDVDAHEAILLGLVGALLAARLAPPLAGKRLVFAGADAPGGIARAIEQFMRRHIVLAFLCNIGLAVGTNLLAWWITS